MTEMIRTFQVMEGQDFFGDVGMFGEDHAEALAAEIKEVFIDCARPGDRLTILVGEMPRAEYEREVALASALTDGDDKAHDAIAAGTLNAAEYLKTFDEHNNQYRNDMLEAKVKAGCEVLRTLGTSEEELKAAVWEIFRLKAAEFYRDKDGAWTAYDPQHAEAGVQVVPPASGA